MLFLKIITSALTIILITEIAKKNSLLGGMVAVLPVNILLSLIWIYLENKNIELLTGFTKSAFLGIIPTMMFLLCITYLLSKNSGFVLSVFVSIFILTIFVLVQQKIISHV